MWKVGQIQMLEKYRWLLHSTITVNKDNKYMQLNSLAINLTIVSSSELNGYGDFCKWVKNSLVER